MMQRLHKQRDAYSLRVEILGEEEVRQFITEHSAVLDEGIGQIPMSDIMRRRLRESNYVFSGIKTFHELHEAFPSLTDKDGNRKPFGRFLNDVRGIDKTYNRNYLRAEYNFVQASASMAARWEQIEQDGDRYNLQYRTAGDDKVRSEHAALDGITLPPSDPFWAEYYPPNGWNCRCTVVQVRKEKYGLTPHDVAMERGEMAVSKDRKGFFHFNPGLEKKTMPDYNPYTIRRCRHCDVPKGNVQLAFMPQNELCQACRYIRQMSGQESGRRLSKEEKRNVRNASLQWCDRHLKRDTNDKGQIVKRLILPHKRMSDGIILNKDFFLETLAKNNRSLRLALTMELAVKVLEYMPTATYMGSEAGKHHPYPFDVYEMTIDGVKVQCKVAVKHSGAYLYTMRIKKNED